MYRIAMILNPKYKLMYFTAKKWPQEWIDAALTVLREHWMTYYKPSLEATAETSISKVTSTFNNDTSIIRWMTPRMIFVELDKFGASTIGNELEEYLKMPMIASVKDPLAGGIQMLETHL
ncbi:hypothetical protein CPB84DRAFT_1755303 [Gymnopilus junonius]|uniref:Uncharacterized protein n=1 Tax=Gymnopilus junonius TaxID=109634 RepID=A0A9P5TEH0_GYMJU|nr:hypothetical protein CPB84DRAFT_1755303 [Gymnopilus junonius]